MPDHHALLVEDDDIMRMSIEDRLILEGIPVTSAATVAEASRLLGTRGFAMMITDVRLPDGDGADLFADVARRHPGLPVIIMTAFGSVSDAVRLVKAGAVDYIEKPFEMADLLDTVRRVLAAAAEVRAGAPHSLKEAVEEAEKAAIVEALDRHDHSMTRSAEALGISRKNLWEKMRRYGLEK